MIAGRHWRARRILAVAAAVVLTVMVVHVLGGMQVGGLRADIRRLDVAIQSQAIVTLVVIEPTLGTVQVPNCESATGLTVELSAIDLAVPFGATPVCVGMAPMEWIAITDDLLWAPRAVYAARAVVPGTVIYLDDTSDAGYTLRVCAIDYASGITCGYGAGS